MFTRANWTEEWAINNYNYPDEFKNNQGTYYNGLRFLLGCARKHPKPTKQQIIDTLCKRFEENMVARNFEIMSEIGDIVHEFSPNKGRELLQRLRDYEREIEEKEEKEEEKRQPNRILRAIEKVSAPTSVYADRQNVHNSTINKSVVENALKLYKLTKKNFIRYWYENKLYYEPIAGCKFDDDYRMECVEYMAQVLLDEHPTEQEIIMDRIQFMVTNTAHYADEGSKKTSLLDIFLSVCYWIHTYKEDEDPKKRPTDEDIRRRVEMRKRIIEELKEMKGLCTTGHLSRLVNVLQGFTEKFVIRISDDDRYQSIVYHLLSTALQNCTDEEVLEGITEPNDKYKLFLKQTVANKAREWFKEYGQEFFDKLPTIVNKFANTEVL